MRVTWSSLLPGFLRPLWSARFAKFCAVGASGVLVNMGSLALLAGAIGAQANLAAALAIEISINTNFLMNELWTFRDRRDRDVGVARRWLRFHLVSFVGAALQWSVFVGGNALVARLGGAAPGAGHGDGGLLGAIHSPPDVGRWIYVSQLAGIAVATLWNFTANLLWTWRREKGAEDHA